MSDPAVRTLGRVSDIDGGTITVGVDFDTVNIDGRRLTSAQAEEFAQLFIRACWAAAMCEGEGRA